jgi:putative transposase
MWVFAARSDTLFGMPYGLKRYQQSEQSHFVTFSCYRRLPRLQHNLIRNIFVESLERMRRSYRFRVYGYVLMPEHVHMLISEPEVEFLAKAIQALKISVARRAMHYEKNSGTLWQKRYYDHNVRTAQSFVEKLRYMHRNPVKRGLVEKPEDWIWSSFRHYMTAEPGAVEIESHWTADLRNGRTLRLLQTPNE